MKEAREQISKCVSKYGAHCDDAAVRTKIGFVLAKTDAVFSSFPFGPALIPRSHSFADARRRLVWA
jgi:hypothetical protein